MPKFRVKYNGQEDLISANTPEQAAVMARLKFANESPTQTLAGAKMGFAEHMPPESAAGGLAALLPIAAPGAAVELAKDAALYGAGTVAEKFGAPSWTGEALGMLRPANALRKGVTGLGARLLGLGAKEVAPTVAAGAARAGAKETEEMTLRRLALAERKIAAQEERNAIARLKLEGGKAQPPRVTPPGPTPVAEKAPILPEGQRTMATNLGGKAKPGPAPTPPSELEKALQQTLESVKAKPAQSSLQGPRLQIGAERVGKPLGMTKEEVRLQAGPRLDEALGEASPILPDVPFGKIIDTLKALPKTGGAREAYVARATSGKARWQVENIRRQLEHLGLLVPAGVAAEAASE